MRLESLSLSNIRSYQEESLSFSDGITLLSGDIGSGKSSVLYAIEFALFGARRGDLAAESLLRHGETSGSVSLDFMLNDKRIHITRSLKRTSSGVRQEPGVLIINDERFELTPVELRARILELLGYPHQLVTKAKDVLFRYTVYTPQEEMKRILSDSSSHRLDVLRAVFGIDTYKTVQENLSVFTKELRSQKKFLQGQVSDLDELLDELKTLRKQEVVLKKDVEESEVLVAKKKDLYQERVASHKELEEQQVAYQKAKQEVAMQKAKKQQLSDTLNTLQVKVDTLTKQVQEDISEVHDPVRLKEKVSEIEKKNLSARASAQTSIDSLHKRITQLENEAEEILTLTECPTCQQDVSANHKNHIRSHANKQIAQLREQQEQQEKILQKTTSNLSSLKDKQSLIKKQEESYRKYQQRLHKQELLKEQLQQTRDEYEQSQKRREELNESSIPIPDFNQEAYTKSKELLDELSEQLTKARIAYNQATTKRESVQSQAQKQEKKVSKKREQQQQLDILTNQESWLSDVFSQAVGDIEQELFSHIHKEFQAKFMHFIHVLLEESGIHAVLDASFTPQITQDGYDIDISTLSGGERQSISLAYRLALNDTINSLVDGLNTVGLLVLDEPTDGFSADQLVRVKGVLSEMNYYQLLLVSHEPHMHSFADNIVSVQKNASRSVIR